MTRLEKIADLYSALTGDGNITSAEINTYAGLSDTVTLEAISATLAHNAVLDFSAMPTNDLLDYMFINLFGYTHDELTAVKATTEGAAGYAYWEDQLANHADVINADTIAIALLNGAAPADQARAEAKVTNVVTAYDAAYPAGGAPAPAPVVDGSHIYLTTDVDHLTGTANNDTFIADLNQVKYTGAVANTLATGDTIDGGAGTDTLDAQLSTQEQIDLGTTTEVQPRTTSVEDVKIEAQDGVNLTFDVPSIAILDAKNMTSVEKIGSSYSDANLIINNLTTLTDAGNIRNTSDMTITMDHTAGKALGNHASDLTVAFDEDYLTTGQATSGSTLSIRMLNAVQNATNHNPVEGFSTITFQIGTAVENIDISNIANNAALDYTTAYSAVVDAINAKLAADGYTTVTASLAQIEPAVFSIPVAAFHTGDSAGQYYPITITNNGPEQLAGVNIATTALSYDTDLNNSFNATAPVTTAVPLSVNVELTKVGRDAEGGNLIIGGNNSTQATAVDQTNGINQFDITVFGDTNLPSNLGLIESTNGALHTVNIASETRTDGSYAALTVRDAFGGTLSSLNANAFKGDLAIGQTTAASNIDTFTATGGGNVTLFEDIGINASVTTGAGADNINLTVDNGGVTVNTGSSNDVINVTETHTSTASIDAGNGDDQVTVSIVATSIADINGNSGNDIITTTGAGTATIEGGAGNDVINGNTVSVAVNDGAGNDVVYVQNDGTKAVQTLATSTENNSSTDTLGSINPGAHDPLDYQLMAGRSVQVTIAAPNATTVAANPYTEGFESSVVAIHTEKAISTLAEYNAAIMKAINEDPVLSHIAVASVDATTNNVVVNYLVDGVADTTADVHVDITAPTYTATDSAIVNMQNEFIASYPDSTITANQVLTAYNSVATTLDATVTQAGTESSNVANSVTLAGGDDFIALSSDTTANAGIDTVKFDAGVNFGSDTIVNFDLGHDVLDFTSFLDDMQDLSSNTNHLSATRIASSITVDAAASVALTSNEVVIVNDFAANGTETWDTLSANALDTALSNNTTSYGNITDATTTIAANAYEATQSSIMMVENNANAGEYKVFEVTETTATDAYAVKLIGTVDFGHQIDATAVVA